MMERGFYCAKHGISAGKECPHCKTLHVARQAEKHTDGSPVYDKNGDRIGSGRGYGGGQGVSSLGPSSPFD